MGLGPVRAPAGAGRRCHGEQGAELVEFAFVVPVFLLVVTASLSLLWLSFMKTAAAQAAKEAARYASVALACPVAGQAWCTTGMHTYPDSDAVAARVNTRVPLFDFAGTDLTITYAWRNTSCVLTDTACQPTPPNATVNVTVTKQVPQPFRPFAGVFNGGDTISATARGETRGE